MSTVNDDVAISARSFIQCVWNAEDGVRHLSDWLAPDYLDHAYQGDAAGLANAIAELRQAFPDAQFEIEDVVAERSTAVLRMRLRATHSGAFRGTAATGAAVDVKVFRWLRFDRGRIAEHWALLDTASLLRQLAA
ncbi:ester cyclase [Novosphingobium sp.]|uniref:ester cyclase n=1 Tax=Novosphingobium sp. TaxID=1874826 RepID=UPI00260F2BA8|nr:ester cyclase [Novosphingobium sp.]